MTRESYKNSEACWGNDQTSAQDGTYIYFPLHFSCQCLLLVVGVLASLLANIQLMLAEVQGIRWLAADTGEMTSHSDVHLISLTWQKGLLDHHLSPTNVQRVLLVVAITSGNFDSTKHSCRALLGGCLLLFFFFFLRKKINFKKRLIN